MPHLHEDMMASRIPGLARAAWPWALLVAMGTLLIWRPAWFEVLGVGVLAVGVIIFVLVLAIYGFAWLAPARAKKAGITQSEASFVGQEHAGSRLRMIELPDATCRVELSLGYYALSFLALGVGGPGLVAMFLANGAVSDLRHPMMIFAALFSIGLCLLLAYLLFVYVFRRPSLTIAPGEVVLRRGRREVKRFDRRDIAELRKDVRVYDDEGNEARCYILVARASDGSNNRLAASGRQEDIDRIAARMRLLLGLR
ncbi:MAG: hypothetical protein ACLPKB_08755 [Xanthobacteraceae bacterium]